VPRRHTHARARHIISAAAAAAAMVRGGAGNVCRTTEWRGLGPWRGGCQTDGVYTCVCVCEYNVCGGGGVRTIGGRKSRSGRRKGFGGVFFRFFSFHIHTRAPRPGSGGLAGGGGA